MNPEQYNKPNAELTQAERLRQKWRRARMRHYNRNKGKPIPEFLLTQEETEKRDGTYLPPLPPRKKRGRPRKNRELEALKKLLARNVKPSVITAYGYGRVSHSKQLKGESVDAQKDRCTSFFKLNLESQNVAWGGFIGEPRNESAYKKSLFVRPAGKLLLSKLNQGDHLIIDKIDRLCRNLADFVRIMEWIKKLNVQLHIVNMMGAQVSMGTPMGNFMLQITTAFAELESAVKSDRIKASFEYGRERGYWKGAKCPIGCRVIGVKPRRRLRWDWRVREIMAEIVRMRDEENLTFARITRKMQVWFKGPGAKIASMARKSRHYNPENWDAKMVVRAYKSERLYRCHEDPTQVNFKTLQNMKYKFARRLPHPPDWKERQLKHEQWRIDNERGHELDREAKQIVFVEGINEEVPQKDSPAGPGAVGAVDAG